MDSTNQKIKILQLNIIFALAEGLVVFWSLIREPSEIQSAVFWGFSPFRIVLLFLVFMLCLILVFLLIASFRGRGWNQNTSKPIWNQINRPTAFWFFLLALGIMYASLFSQYKQLELLYSYRERLSPLLIWLGLISLQVLASYLYMRNMGLKVSQIFRNVLAPSWVSLILLSLLIAFIYVSGIGLMPDSRFWQKAGAPIVLPQVLFALAAVLATQMILKRLTLLSPGKLNFLISIGLWGIACLTWLGQTARVSYNSLSPSAPNFQSYPFGDAMIYDITAHEYLIGKPIPSEFGIKPLYSLFLAILHMLSGENYKTLISIQIVVLAIIPVFVYWIVVLLANRPAGLLAALLVILRERNGIALSNVIEVSHLKLLMSDVFAMGLVTLFLWLFLCWCEKPEKHRGPLLVSGGVLSLLVLTRGHPVVLFPLAFCIVLALGFIPFRLRLQGIMLLTVGVFVPLAPWFVRIYEASGKISFQDPESSYTTHFARSYSLEAGIPVKLADETNKEYYDRINEQARRFIFQHPVQVANFILSHVMHNTILSYVYLPHSLRLESLRAYMTTVPFWQDWDGRFPTEGIVLLCFNIFMIALGLGSSWDKKRFAALIPFLIGVGYNVSVSIGRISGWRYIQPADWITLIYYAIGLIQFSYIIGFIVNAHRQSDLISTESRPQTEGSPAGNWVWHLGSITVLLVISMALTYGNRLFAGRYPLQSEEELTGEYLRLTVSLGQLYTENELHSFLQSDRSQIMYGQAVYPYFLRANSGPINHALPAYKPRPYSRLVFYLVGPEAMNVVLPIPSGDFDFPDGAEVMVLGCVNDFGDVEALAVLLAGESPSLFMREPIPEMACPLSTPE
jgi:hypothetical protein